MSDYAAKLISDLPEQFKGKERIEAFMTVVGRQLDEVLQFYEDLNTNRTLSTAVGAQLDKIGSIVGLTRAEASALMSDGEVAANDELYRSVLIYKIMLNTSTSTYYDIVTGMRQFYDVDVSYSENIDVPAAISLDLGTMAEVVTKIYTLPYIKAGGVRLIISENASENMMLYSGCSAILEARTVQYTECTGADLDTVDYITDEIGNTLTDENGDLLYD